MKSTVCEKQGSTTIALPAELPECVACEVCLSQPRKVLKFTSTWFRDSSWVLKRAIVYYVRQTVARNFVRFF